MTSCTVPRPDAFDEAPDLQVVRADALQRRERAHQHVVGPLKSRVFSMAETFCGSSTTQMSAAVARLVGAEAAGIDVGDGVAGRAVRDALLHVADGVAEALGVLARGAQDVEREALRALAADTRQFLQLVDEAREGFGLGMGTAVRTSPGSSCRRASRP